MATGKTRLATGLKRWFDFVFFLSLGLVLLITAWVALSPFAERKEEGMQVSVPVSVGESSLLPILALRSFGPSGQDARAHLVRGRGELRFRTHDLKTHLLSMSTMILGGIVTLYVLVLLRRMLEKAVEGRPFHPENVKRLAALGWVGILTGVLVPLVEYLASRAALSGVDGFTPPVAPPLDVRLEWILSGLLLLLLSRIWRQAVEMAEDQALTV